MRIKENAMRSAYLQHHGIVGQKWGHRQGPPYPLDPGKHSSAEKKAGWRKSLDDGDKKEDKKSVKKSSPKPKQELSDEDKEARRKAVMKKVAIGMAIGVGSVAAVSLAKSGMKYINNNPDVIVKMSEKVSNSKVAQSLADLDHTTKEFKSNVKKNVEKTRHNLETAQRERAKVAKTNFDKVESEYLSAHSRAREQEETAKAMDFIRKNRNNKYDPISRSKAQDLMKKYSISDQMDDEALLSRANLHRKAVTNLTQKERSMSERYNKALSEYMDANGSNEKSRRKREKLQRIMQEAIREM